MNFWFIDEKQVKLDPFAITILQRIAFELSCDVHSKYDNYGANGSTILYAYRYQSYEIIRIWRTLLHAKLHYQFPYEIISFDL